MIYFRLFIIFFFISNGLGILSAQDIVYACPPCQASCDDLRFDQLGVCPHCGMTLLNEAEIKRPIKIAFYLQPGVEVLDFAGPLEVFSYAGFEVMIVAKTLDPIISQGVLKVQPEYSIDNAPIANIVAFFGGNAANTSNDPEVIAWLKEQNPDVYFSVCTGAFFLAEAGLLQGRIVTTFHDALNDLEHRFPATEVRRNVRFVDSGDLITTAGISAGIDGALHLVARLRGFNAARAVAYHMEYDKWVPGEGLIIGEENPYFELPDKETLSVYEGIYEWTDGQKIAIQYGENEESLIAVLTSGRYPLFFASQDEFMDVDQDKVVFQRDDSGAVISFTVEGRERVFKRKH